MKKIFIILLFTLLISCKQYTAVTPEKPIHILTLENNIIGTELFESNYQVFIKNISNQLIIEIDYNNNNDTIIIYDDLVPNEKL